MWKLLFHVYGLYKPCFWPCAAWGKLSKNTGKRGMDGSKKCGSVIYYYRVFFMMPVLCAFAGAEGAGVDLPACPRTTDGVGAK